MPSPRESQSRAPLYKNLTMESNRCCPEARFKMCSLDKTDVKSICKVLTTQNCSDKISLVFGPEGGLNIREEELLVEKGFTKTSLGEDVLRTETVPLMIASIVKYLKECD